jgi:hypothetical protein
LILQRRFESLAGSRGFAGVHQIFERIHVAALVSRFIHGSFRNKRSMCEAGMVQQAAKRLQPYGSLPDVLMTVKP